MYLVQAIRPWFKPEFGVHQLSADSSTSVLDPMDYMLMLNDLGDGWIMFTWWSKKCFAWYRYARYGMPPEISDAYWMAHRRTCPWECLRMGKEGLVYVEQIWMGVE